MVVEVIAELAVSLISSGGYFWVFFLMVLESMIFPIPSEAVMPLAGYLISLGKFSWFWVILFSTLGSLVGSLISYWIGLFGGRRFMRKFGKYFLLDEEHLMWTEKFFEKRGEIAIFISRFLPVVRHLISIPAGTGKMNLKKFLVYTFLGAGLWNGFLAWLGYFLSDKWILIHKYSQPLDILILALIIICIGWWIWKHIKRRKRKNK